MTVYFGTDGKHVTPSMTATHATVTGLTARPENVGHKIHKDSFSPPVLFDNLHTKAINCCGTVGPNQRGIHMRFGETTQL
jgi:hypothetical protein